MIYKHLNNKYCEIKMMEIAILGPQKSGKTSIKSIVFDKMSPHESVFNETTTNVESLNVNSLGYAELRISEIPSTFSAEKPTAEEAGCLKTCEVIIYVFDSQDTSSQSLDYFKDNVIPLALKNPELILAVFIHKTDSLSQGDSLKQIGEIQSKLQNIANNSVKNITFYPTTIYDYSLFETFSKIFQKIMPQSNLLCSFLDTLTMNCQFERAYLFDVFNKIYLAVDSFSVASRDIYEICSDMIDVVLDMCGIYGEENDNDSYFDENSMSTIHINKSDKEGNDSVLYLRLIGPNIALIALINKENFEKPHLLDHNIDLFRGVVKKILKI